MEGPGQKRRRRSRRRGGGGTVGHQHGVLSSHRRVVFVVLCPRRCLVAPRHLWCSSVLAVVVLCPRRCLCRPLSSFSVLAVVFGALPLSSPCHYPMLVPRVNFDCSQSSGTDPDDGVADVTSSSALDVVEIKHFDCSLVVLPLATLLLRAEQSKSNSVCFSNIFNVSPSFP